MENTAVLKLKNSNNNEVNANEGATTVAVRCGNRTFFTSHSKIVSNSAYCRRNLKEDDKSEDELTLDQDTFPSSSAVFAAFQLIQEGSVKVEKQDEGDVESALERLGVDFVKECNYRAESIDVEEATVTEEAQAAFDAKLTALDAGNVDKVSQEVMPLPTAEDSLSEADTEVNEELEVPETPVKEVEAVTFRTIFGEIKFGGQVLTNQEEMSIKVSGDDDNSSTRAESDGNTSGSDSTGDIDCSSNSDINSNGEGSEGAIETGGTAVDNTKDDTDNEDDDPMDVSNGSTSFEGNNFKNYRDTNGSDASFDSSFVPFDRTLRSESAAERLFREISETLPVFFGEGAAKDDFTHVITRHDEHDTAGHVETSTPKRAAKRRSSGGSSGSGSASGKVKRRRHRYSLRNIAKASKDNDMHSCSSCGYWTYRKRDLKKHEMQNWH